MKDVLGNHLKDQIFHLVHWLSITCNCEGPVKNPSLWKENLTWIVPVRGVEFGRVTYWLQTLRSWKRWTHQKSTQQRLIAKEVIFPKEGEFIFPIADGRIKTPGGDQSGPENIQLGTASIKRESNIDFLGEKEGSLPPTQDSLPDAGEAINDFWSMSGNFIHRHHVEHRVKLYSPRDESFPIPLKCIDVSRTTHTNLDVKQEKRIDDHWSIDGSRDLSLNLLYWKTNLQKDICGPGRD